MSVYRSKHLEALHKEWKKKRGGQNRWIPIPDIIRQFAADLNRLPETKPTAIRINGRNMSASVPIVNYYDVYLAVCDPSERSELLTAMNAHEDALAAACATPKPDPITPLQLTQILTSNERRKRLEAESALAFRASLDRMTSMPFLFGHRSPRPRPRYG